MNGSNGHMSSQFHPNKFNVKMKKQMGCEQVEEVGHSSRLFGGREAHVCAKSLQLCPTHCDPVDRSPPGSSVPEDSPGKNTGVGCHALRQGIFLTQGLNLSLLYHLQAGFLYHWQAGFFTTSATWEAQEEGIMKNNVVAPTEVGWTSSSKGWFRCHDS